MMKWLDKVPMALIIISGIFLALAPFTSEPHLLQKINMLFDGTLVQPVDMFDLLWHSSPMIILVLKLIRNASNNASNKEPHD